MTCKACEEKDRRIRALLSGYRKDKKIYRIAIIALFILNMLVLAFGANGVKMGFDFFKEVVK